MNEIYREQHDAPMWMTVALIGPGLVVAAAILAGIVQHEFSWSMFAVALIPAVLGYTLWRQFHVLLVQVDPEALRVGFGFFTKTIMRSTIVSAKPIRVHLWNTGGLGIRRGWGYEAWVSSFGDAVELTLTNKKKFVVTASNPVALCTILSSTHA